MKLKLLFFAALREQLDLSDESVDFPEAVNDVASLRTHLMQRGDAWQRALAPGRALRVAVNQDMAEASTPLRAGDEVAFFPPVTGG